MAKAGRPKVKWTNAQIEQIDDLASINCKDYTIAECLDVSLMSLKRHFGKRMIQKRAQGRVKLRQYQEGMAKTSPAMAIFLGKNELNQTDRQDIHQTGDGLQIVINEPKAKPGPNLVKDAG